MQKLDPNKLFSLFEATDEQVYSENHAEDLLKNPYVLMGMVVRGMENFQLLHDMYTYKYGEEYKNVVPVVRHRYFRRLYGFLDRITFEDYSHKYMIGKDFDVKSVYRCLYTLLKYFEQEEEYMKCAKIKKYMDLLTTEELYII